MIISKLSELMNNGTYQNYSTMTNADCLIYPVVICTLFLSFGLTIALTLLRATYRHPTYKNIAKNLDNQSIIDIATPVAKAVAETCKFVLKYSLLIVMRKIKAIYRKRGIQMCDKKNEDKPLSSDFDPFLKSTYEPKKDHEVWVSFRGQYGVNSLRTDIAKMLFHNIEALSKLEDE